MHSKPLLNPCARRFVCPTTRPCARPHRRAYGNDYDEKTPYKGYSPQFYCNRDYGYGADASANQQ